MDETLQKDIVNSVTKTIEDSVPEIVDTLIEKNVGAKLTKTEEELVEVKKEVAKLNVASREHTSVKKDWQKEAVVSIFKEVVNNGVSTEKGFNDVVENVLKTMTEGTPTEGAELVFDQFENDVLRVINSYDIIGDVRILPLAKGDKVSLPKATNGVTTYFVNEGNAPTATEATTAFVVIDIARAATLTDMTTELLDDTMTVPDLYDLLVEFIAESQAEFLETQILTGTGAVKGILVNASVNEEALAATETAGDIDDEALVKVVSKASRKFKRNRANVKWYMSQYVFSKIMALITTDGYPLYPEMRQAEPMLMGYKVVMSDVGFVQDSTEDVADATLLLFGDLRYFTLARRKGITLERGYYGDNWKKDIQSLKSNSRYGGTCTFPEALTILSNGAVS